MKRLVLLLCGLCLLAGCAPADAPADAPDTRPFVPTSTVTTAATVTTASTAVTAPTTTATTTVATTTVTTTGTATGTATRLPIDPLDIVAGSKGTAGDLCGRVLIVSVFVDDATTHWAGETAIPARLRRIIATATDWLTGQVARYGRSVEFLWDWERYPDLRKRLTFAEKLVRQDGSMYTTQKERLLDSFDLPALKAKYAADEIAFFCFFNTPYENQVNPWTLSRNQGELCRLEFSNFYCRFKDFDLPAATIAHEIMHQFGAIDFYYTDKGVPQAFVDHCAATGSQDIMYTVNAGDRIAVDFTDLDAYYVGLLPTAPELDEWHLPKRIE